MSKRDPTRPGAFSVGLKEHHYQGESTKAKRLVQKAKSAQQRRIKWLKRLHGNNAAARALAKKLAQCRPKLRCRSGACPVCAQAAQELFVTLIGGLGHEG
jgi:hypothetical protein